MKIHSPELNNYNPISHSPNNYSPSSHSFNNHSFNNHVSKYYDPKKGKNNVTFNDHNIIYNDKDNSDHNNYSHNVNIHDYERNLNIKPPIVHVDLNISSVNRIPSRAISSSSSSYKPTILIPNNQVNSIIEDIVQPPNVKPSMRK